MHLPVEPKADDKKFVVVESAIYFLISLSLDWHASLDDSHNAGIDRPKWVRVFVWAANWRRRRPSVQYCGQVTFVCLFTVTEFRADNDTSPTLSKMIVGLSFLPYLKIGTPKFRRFIIDILPWKNLHNVRDIVDVLHNTSVEIFETRKKALEEGDETQIGQGKDIMSTLSTYPLLLLLKCSWLNT